MEFKPASATLHYACAFEIKDDFGNTMTDLRKEFGMWIGNKEKLGASLVKPNFFLGNIGQDRIGTHGSLLRTAVNYGAYPPENPFQWALEYIHQDSQPYRLWSTEVGLTRNDGWIRLAMAVSHWVRPSYILHDMPIDPNPTTPLIIRSIIKKYECKKFRDGLVLSSAPIIVDFDNVKVLIENIDYFNRNIPLIVVAPEIQLTDHTSRLPLDVEQLAKLVAGNANVYYFESGDVRRQFQDLVGYEMACLPYSLRIYMPKTNDSKKHRFFDKRFFEDHGENEVISLVCASISRYGNIFKVNEAIGIQDIVYKRNFEYLKTKLSSSHSSDTQDNNNTIKEFEKFFDEISLDHEKLEAKNKELEEEKLKLSGQLHALKYKKVDVIHSDCSNIALFPETLNELLIQGCKIFSDKVDYTERAIASSSKASLDKKYYSFAWEIIKDVATILHPVIFDDNLNDFEGEFNKRSNFEMAKTEGKQTKNNKDLMKLRQDIYKGKEIDITMHIKYGGKDPQKLLRVHFYIDKDSEKLIIGHFGNHLDNSVTRKN